MTYSVWQDGRFKGALAVRYPAQDDSRGVGGIFIPATDYSDIVPVIQYVPDLPHRPKLQYDVPARSRSPGTATCEPLLPLSEEDARGVAAERVLELRDEQGNVIPTTMLMLDVFEVPEGDGALPEACQELGIAGEGWELSAVFETDRDEVVARPHSDPQL